MITLFTYSGFLLGRAAKVHTRITHPHTHTHTHTQVSLFFLVGGHEFFKKVGTT